MTEHAFTAWVESDTGRRYYDARCSCGHEILGITDFTQMSDLMQDHLDGARYEAEQLEDEEAHR